MPGTWGLHVFSDSFQFCVVDLPFRFILLLGVVSFLKCRFYYIDT